MQEEYVKIVERFGISPTASKVYIALIELGKSSADALAKRVGTYKANTYDALGRLIEIGLVTYVVEKNRKIYMATSPEKLGDIAEEAKQKSVDSYEDLKKDLKKILPKLSAKYSSLKEKDLFEVYVGRQAYRSLIKDILREKPKHWKGFGNLQVQEFFKYDFKSWFRDVKFMLFATKSHVVAERLKEARKTTNVKIKWLPEELQMQVVWTLFGENLLILIYEPDIIAMRVKSKQVVDTFNRQFDYLWKKYAD